VLYSWNRAGQELSKYCEELGSIFFLLFPYPIDPRLSLPSKLGGLLRLAAPPRSLTSLTQNLGMKSGHILITPIECNTCSSMRNECRQTNATFKLQINHVNHVSQQLPFQSRLSLRVGDLACRTQTPQTCHTIRKHGFHVELFH
jgi:hypothetical protein